MTDISEAALEQADCLAAQQAGSASAAYRAALARLIQQFSDVAKESVDILGIPDHSAREAEAAIANLDQFILPDPVDPLLIEAREIVATSDHDPWPGSPWHVNQAELIRAGRGDDMLVVRAAYNGLKRGMELASQAGASK
jgi:hypothetical protein